MCETFHCENEIWAACINCQCLLCFDHFEKTSPCELHNRMVPYSTLSNVVNSPERNREKSETVCEALAEEPKSDSQTIDLDGLDVYEICDISSETTAEEVIGPLLQTKCQQQFLSNGNDNSEMADVPDLETPNIPDPVAFEEAETMEINTSHMRPEEFHVEGECHIEETTNEEQFPKITKAQLAKQSRNSGLSYVSLHSKKNMPARKGVGPRCKSTMCEKRGYQCSMFNQSQRVEIQN